MINAVSCGGVVIHRGKILLLYKNRNGKHMGWVLPKGTKEIGESLEETAVREVREETSTNPEVIKYIGSTNYEFQNAVDVISKTVHWYLMQTSSFSCKPQAEEFFADAGYYKYHEAFHLLKFKDEKQILKKAFFEYNELRKMKKITKTVKKK